MMIIEEITFKNCFYMKSSFYLLVYSITPRSPFKVNRSFSGSLSSPFQSLSISQARNQCESKWQEELS
jgi:hypothetical protein